MRAPIKRATSAPKATKSTKPAAVKKYQRGGRVQDDSDIPEERGPRGLLYNSLLRDLRASRERERRAARNNNEGTEFEWVLRDLENQGFLPPTNEQLAARAGRESAINNETIGGEQRLQRLYERLLEREGKRIGAAPRYSQGRLEDSGFKKGGKVTAKKGKR